MSRYLITLLGLVLLLAVTVQAGPPAANGSYSAGWGMNPTNWQTATGSYNSGLALYDPLGAGGGAGWLVGWNPYIYINYTPITIELWIEMYMIQTYQYTSYQFHRLGNAAENLSFTITGTVESNEGVWVLCTAGTLDPNFLHFQHNIGVGDDHIRGIFPSHGMGAPGPASRSTLMYLGYR